MSRKTRPKVIILLSVVLSVLSAGAQETEAQQKELPKADVGVIVLPIVFNMPETGWGGGVGGLLTYRPAGSTPAARPSSLYFYALYTQLEQFSAQWLPEVYSRDEEYLLKGKFQFDRYPEKFWGMGGGTSSEMEEDYTPRAFILEVSFSKKIWASRKIYAGVLCQFESYKILQSDPGGQLDGGLWPGSDRAVSSGAGLIINWDTRDNTFYPLRGRFWQVSAAFNLRALGSGFDYTALKLDFRQYVPLFSSHVLALQGLYQAAAGDPPFKSYAKLGGDSIMRGYYSGRYRDKHLFALQAEYRMPLWWRFGLVGFAALGDVACRPAHFGREGLKYSLGFGVRFKVAPREGTNIRLDLAWGKGTSGFYFTANEAF